MSTILKRFDAIENATAVACLLHAPTSPAWTECVREIVQRPALQALSGIAIHRLGHPLDGIPLTPSPTSIISSASLAVDR